MFLDDWEQLDRADIRPATPSDVPAVARLHVDCWRSLYRGIVPDEVLDGLSYADRERQWMRLIAGGDSGPFVYVADHPRDRVVGFMAGTTTPSSHTEYPGEVYVVYVDERHADSGIGRELMQLAARIMAENGLPGMLAWAIAGSPVEDFYRGLHGQRIATRSRPYGEATIEEIAFGWSDLNRFGEPPAPGSAERSAEQTEQASEPDSEQEGEDG